jgi:hypothetical protein
MDGTTELETKYLAIGYERQVKNPTLLFAIQDVDNPIYASGRELTIWINSTLSDIGIIDSFEIKGYQDLLSLDSTKYHSKCKVFFN